MDLPPSTPEDSLLALASAIDPDGGMPGKTPEARAAATAMALLAFLAHGHTPTAGAFRSHVARLAKFLESLTGLEADKRKLADTVLAAVRSGQAPEGDWLKLSETRGIFGGR